MRNWHSTLLYKNPATYYFLTFRSMFMDRGRSWWWWVEEVTDLFVMLLTLSSVLYTYVMCLNNAFRLGCQFFGCRTPKYICNPFFSKIKFLQEKIFLYFCIFEVMCGILELWSWALICKRLWSPGIDFEESILPAYVACGAGTIIRVFVPASQPENRFSGSLKGIQIRALYF